MSQTALEITYIQNNDFNLIFYFKKVNFENFDHTAGTPRRWQA